MDIDLDLCEAELDAEVQNLRLLRKQMQSIQSIKTELRRKDNLIAVLKSKVISLETKLLSSEEEAEQLTTQLNTALHFHEADTLSRISGLQQQLGSLQQKIAELQEARDAEQIT
jgi:chromosome segregation ATPase